MLTDLLNIIIEQVQYWMVYAEVLHAIQWSGWNGVML